MAISIICMDKEVQPWLKAFAEQAPELDVRVWPDDGDRAEVTFALCWKHPQGVLRQYPNLKCISSMGAGIDHLLNDTDFPGGVPVVRLVDPNLASAMFEYVNAAVMYFQRAFDVYRIRQQQALWQQNQPKSNGQTTIGIMGLGQLGSHVGAQLADLGFHVVGWSRAGKSVKGIEGYAGDEGLTAFLAQSEILVCLLPLTEQTRGILNAELFSQLPKGACVINVARGEHLVEQDLIQGLDNKQLRGACLDVFSQEPLPQDHPFWQRQDVIVTPHCSSITLPSSVVEQIVENYLAVTQQDRVLVNQVDIQRGY